MSTRRLLPVMLMALGACAAPRPPGPTPRNAGIDTMALRTHTRVLAHDSLRGRGTGDPMTRLAARYVADQCQALGLEPVGNGYLHQVPLIDAGLQATSTVLVVGTADSMVARHGRDFLVTGGDYAALGTPITGRAVWLGNADTLPEPLPQLRDQVGVVVGLPDPAVAERVAAAGARALIALMGSDATLGQVATAFGHPLRFATSIPSSYFAAIPVIVGGTRLSRAVAPVARGERRTVTIGLAPNPREVPAWNVACRLVGTDARLADTAIVYTAHYDHLGVRQPVAGDSVYNGFSDNAAGVAMLLAIAKAMGEDPLLHPRHSVLFVFFSGEERGLLGSDWWVARGPWPVERTRAVINLDAGAPPGRVWSWRLAGGTASWLGALGQDVAAAHGWTATLSEARANSDYFPFHRLGVPAVFPIPTPAPYEGLTTDSSLALRRRWDRYHHPGDEWFADFPFEGLQRYAEFALWIGLAVDSRTGR